MTSACVPLRRAPIRVIRAGNRLPSVQKRQSIRSRGSLSPLVAKARIRLFSGSHCLPRPKQPPTARMPLLFPASCYGYPNECPCRRGSTVMQILIRLQDLLPR
ncbi:MAG: hypothetical protein FD153_2037 [Rhodospirillaceae bacterium]|nr:MAG: hypothetical protein FD153_2037 [Rhodospirillaceae bacterium]